MRTHRPQRLPQRHVKNVRDVVTAVVCSALGLALLLALGIFMFSRLACGGVPRLKDLFVLATQLQRTHALEIVIRIFYDI